MTNDKNGTAAEIVQAFIEKQRKSAAGQRLAMLNRDLSGTIKLLTDILLPVFGSLEGFHLEYEIVGAKESSSTRTFTTSHSASCSNATVLSLMSS
ncbi:hypothetical protein OMP38_30260 [Cohnella ginsengisoli]|uniref:Uncharacterized protein n=1 Tax=Cohnella ginsengisoli TaxID=425004 RepID=A0A9X4KM63_9BACL|nr:hypothetical protein [Cohnella ginsengisoli]MDG0794648.1 hypothetical protein [Cohnella ginsengisoli]